MSQDATRVMQCMEVWGGNAQTESSVSMSGLDAWVYCQPYGSADAGGDVYYVSSCATGRITRLLVADVSGHGAAVHETAIVLRTLMRRYVNALDQRHFVRSMNRQFVALSDAGCFATAVVTTFFAPTNYLTLCNAGHPLPLLYRAKARRWSFLENTTESRSKKVANIPLGIADIADYEQFTTRLNVGDLVMCYSDSLIESHSSSGEMLGQRGLLALANDIDVAEPPRAIANLLSRIKSLAVENLKGDDVTVLLFRVNGSAVRVSLAGKVMGSLRVLRGLIGSILPRGGPAPLPDLSLANLGGALFDRLNRLWRGPK